MVIFSTTFNCDIRACQSFQPWENQALNAREHLHQQKSARRILGDATRHTSNNTFPIFLEVCERQELLEQELTSNNSVLVFCSCECVHAFSIGKSPSRNIFANVWAEGCVLTLPLRQITSSWLR